MSPILWDKNPASGQQRHDVRLTQSATEMIPRMRFSIKIELEFLAAARVKHERRKKQNRRADVNNINHRFRFKNVNIQGIASIPIHRGGRL
jgi:hypothetical protein